MALTYSMARTSICHPSQALGKLFQAHRTCIIASVVRHGMNLHHPNSQNLSVAETSNHVSDSSLFDFLLSCQEITSIFYKQQLIKKIPIFRVFFNHNLFILLF